MIIMLSRGSQSRLGSLNFLFIKLAVQFVQVQSGNLLLTCVLCDMLTFTMIWCRRPLMSVVFICIYL